MSDFHPIPFFLVPYIHVQEGVGQHFQKVSLWRDCVHKYRARFQGWVQMWPLLPQNSNETTYSFLWEMHRHFHASYSLVWIVAFIMNLLVQGFNSAKQLCFRLLFGTQHHQYKNNGLFGQFNKIQYLNCCQARRQAKMRVEVFRFYKPYSNRTRHLSL